MVKRVLLIAYHFPPVKISSGIQRTLRFAQYLPQFGWEPMILAPHPRAYAAVSDEDMQTVSHLKVSRTFALDTARHLSVAGRFPRLAAIPDRWVTWCLGAIPAGLRMIRRWQPDVIWSTYPIATAHLIGLALHRMTGVPWVADLRDPMAQEGYPEDPVTHRSFRWIERQIMAHATNVTFTTQGALREYSRRYPERRGSFSVIENGYDESAFVAAEDKISKAPRNRPARTILLHSGVVYPSERDPRALFAALRRLLDRGVISGGSLEVRLRATGHDEYLRGLIAEAGVQSVVQLHPAIAYEDALVEMLSVDALLILQAANCNDQVPAKLYEYLRAKRPIIGLAAGDTAQALKDAGVGTIAPLESVDEICRLLNEVLPQLHSGVAALPLESAVASASRFGRTRNLGALFDVIAGARGDAVAG